MANNNTYVFGADDKQLKAAIEGLKNNFNSLDDAIKGTQKKLSTYLEKSSELEKLNQSIETQKIKVSSLKKSVDDLNNSEEKNKDLIKEKTKLYKEEKSILDNLVRNYNAQKQANNKRIQTEKQRISILKEGRNETEKDIAAINKQTNAIENSRKKTSNATNAVVRHLRQIETLVVAYYTLSKGFQNTIGIGIQVSRMVEDNTSGIAALLSANTRMILSNGEAVDSYEKFKMGLLVAKDTMEDLRKASIQTYASFPALTEIFQQAIGQTLAMGDSFGKTTDEIISNTIKLSQRMSNIAGAIGMPMDRVREEIRSILSGNASTDSLISTMLFGSPGEANKAIRLAKQRGANGVKEMLDEMLKPFDALSTQKTFTRSMLALEDAWKNTMMKIVQDSGAFKDIQNIMDDMTSSMNDNIEEITKSFDKLYKMLKLLGTSLDEILVIAAAFYGGKGLISAFKILNKEMKATSNTTELLKGSLKGIGRLAAPIIAIAGALSTIGFANKQMSEYADGMSAKYKKIYEDRVKASTTTETDLNLIKQFNRELDATQKRLKTSKALTESQTSILNTQVRELKSQLILLEARKDLTKEERKDAEVRIKNSKESIQLLTKIGLKNEVLDKIQKEINKDQSKTVSLEKEIIKLQDIKLKGQKALSEAKTVNEIKTAKKAIETIDQALLLKREKLAEVQAKELQKLSKEEAIRFKIKSYMDGAIKLESYQQDLQTLKIQTLNKEFATLQKKEDKQAKLLEILKEQAKLEEMIYKKELKDDRSLDKLFKETEKYKIKIELDGYGEVNKQLDGMYKAYKDIAEESKNWNKYTENYNKLMVEAQKQGKDTAKYKEQYNKNEEAFQAAQIVGYANIAGAMSKVFKEGSDGANAALVAQSALASYNAVNAMLAAWSAPFPANLATVPAAMAAVSGLLSNIGMAFNFGKETKSVGYDAFAGQEANTGSGTTLGDKSQTSESILNSLNILESYVKPEFNLLSEMNKSLISIDQKMGGVAGLLINQGGFAFGEGFNGYNKNSGNILSEKVATGVATGGIGLLLNELKIPILSDISGALGKGLNSVLGGLFGKTSQSRSLSDSGIAFSKQLLSQALEDFEGQAYQVIKTETTKKSWFKKSTSISYDSYFESLDNETERQFGLVLNSLYDAVVKSGSALDIVEKDIESELSDFYVNVGKISLKGKSGEDIQKTLSSVFGKLGDQLAKEVYPFLESFQQIGEGLFETMTRVSTGIIEAEYYLSKLGVAFDDINHSDIMNPQGEVGFEGLYSGIVKTDESIYGVNNNIVKLIQNLNGTAEELYTAYTALESLRTQFKFLGHDFEGITSDMIAGSGGIENLRDSINSYIENFYTEEEQLVAQTNLLKKEFAKFNIEIPKTIEGFKEIIEDIDLTTKEGQELYGRLISLSGSFSKLIEDSSGKIKDKMTILFETMNKGVENIFDSISRMSQSTKEALEGLRAKDTFSQLVEYNKKLKEFRESRASGDTESSESLYNELLGLSKGIAGESQYEKAIRDTLSSNLSGFELEKQTLRVNIVEGLGELLSLNSEQVEQLKTSVEDGKATNEELNSISGITQEQKDGIIEFSNNSNYFSTEKQQENANELMKLQLQALKQQSAIDTDPLSSKSFEYGDVIGKKEQKDIATLYGTSYENIAPFIENIQSLEVSQDKTDDLKQMLGFTGISINEDVYSNIQKLSPYIGDIATQAQAIKFEAEKNNFTDRISAATASFASTDLKYIASKTSMIESLKRLQIAQMGDVDKGIGYTFTGTDEGDFKENYNKYKAAFDNTYSFRKAKDVLQESILKLNEEKLAKGYYQGGFTGYGNPTEVAGVVHKSEYVVNHSKLNTVGGVAGMEALLNGNLGGTFRSLINGVVETNKAVINELSQVKEATTRMVAPLAQMSTNQQVEMSYLKKIQDSVEQ